MEILQIRKLPESGLSQIPGFSSIFYRIPGISPEMLALSFGCNNCLSQTILPGFMIMALGTMLYCAENDMFLHKLYYK